MLQNRVKERVKPLAGIIERLFRNALLSNGVHDREVELLVGSTEIDKQLHDLVQHFFRACIGAVDLVDDHDGCQPHLEGLTQYEAGLRKGAFRSVDKEEHAVNR